MPNYKINKELLKELLNCRQRLAILEVAGVDNWMSYHQAAELSEMELPTEEFLEQELQQFEIIN